MRVFFLFFSLVEGYGFRKKISKLMKETQDHLFSSSEEKNKSGENVISGLLQH